MDIINLLLTTILPFLVVLTIIVFVHEYGHYIVAKWCGVHSEVFSVGLGKELFARTDRHGTRWRFAAFPIGGYVKFLGDTNAASMPTQNADFDKNIDQSRAFPTAALWKRTLIVAAGPMFNFILSILVFAGIFIGFGRVQDTPVAGPLIHENTQFEKGDIIKSVNGRPVNSMSDAIDTLVVQGITPARITIERDGRIQTILQKYDAPTQIGIVIPGGAAENAGIQYGDVIESIDGKPVGNFRDVQTYVGEWEEGSPPLRLQILRDGMPLVFDITPTLQERPDPETREPRVLPTVGVSSTPVSPEDVFGFSHVRERPNLFEALWMGTERTYGIIEQSLRYVSGLILGKQSAEQLGGPIGIARISGEAAQTGLENFLMFIALISTSIGLLNLFPIPILDGGHLVFYAIEAIRGRPASQRLIEVSTSIGFTLLLGIMVFATWNDITRL